MEGETALCAKIDIRKAGRIGKILAYLLGDTASEL